MRKDITDEWHTDLMWTLQQLRLNWEAKEIFGKCG